MVRSKMEKANFDLVDSSPSQASRYRERSSVMVSG
jgi:hypothetical protein